MTATENIEVLIQEAISCIRNTNYRMALSRCSQIIKKDRNNYFVKKNLPIILKALGKNWWSYKAFQEATTLFPKDSVLRYNYGNLLVENGMYKEAIREYATSIDIDKMNDLAYLNLSKLLIEQKQFTKALEVVELALSSGLATELLLLNFAIAANKLKKNSLLISRLCNSKFLAGSWRLNNALSVAYKDCFIYKKALEFNDKALAIDSKNLTLYSNRAVLLQKLGRLDEAEQSFKKSLACTTKTPEIFANYAILLGQKNEVVAANQMLERAIELEPDNAELYRIYGLWNKVSSPQDPFITKLHHIRDTGQYNPETKHHLFYALGKIYEELGDFKNAIDAFGIANSIRRSTISYSMKATEQIFRSAERLLTCQTLHKEGCQPLTKKVIFLVGMPRSGTSLIEQVLSAHPEVTAGGELEYMDTTCRSYLHESFTHANIDLAKIRGKYLNELFIRFGGQTHLVDKMPQNFLYVGLIAAAFPECPIIIVKRNKYDVLLSNYKNFFTSEGQHYSYSWEECADYIERAYKFFEVIKGAQLPTVIDVDYETLVKDPARSFCALFERLGFHFSEKYLDKALRSSRYVPTASTAQVREEIKGSFVNSWSRYEPYIEQSILKRITTIFSS